MNEKKFTFPLIMVVLGMLVTFGSFGLGLLNMGYGIFNAFLGDGQYIVFMFIGHIVAMAAMAFGVLISTIGTYLGGWTILKSYILPALSKYASQ